jgi:Rab family protein
LNSHYRKAVGALLVYDVTKKSTFYNCQRWLSEVRQFTEPYCIVMLVGNKIDLVERNNKKREVSYEEGKAFAIENQIMFSETSALSNLRVTESFEDLLQEIYNERRKVSRIQKKGNSGTIILNAPNKKEDYNKNCC